MTSRTLRLLIVTAGLSLACSGGGGGGGGADSPTAPAPPADPSVVTIEVDDFSFEPRSVTIQPGQTVRWVFTGQDTTHTATARSGEFDSGFAFRAPGDAFEHTFDAGDDGQTFEYSCASHADCCDMKGSVRVGADAPAPDPGYD